MTAQLDFTHTSTQTMHHGDCLDIMKSMADNSIDFIVTDPPYGLTGKSGKGGFMGKEWDHGIPGSHFWTEALRICKPGAMLFAFGGTRTYHRLTCAIEDAGWEIRDCLMWLYASGFPKSLNIGKALDKCGGQSLWWFPEFIKNERKKRCLSVEKFAELLKPAFPETNCLRWFIEHWEKNRQRPTNEKFNAICKILELPFQSIEEAEREVISEIKQRANSNSSFIKLNCSVSETEKITIASSEIAKTFDGYGTALKPAYEPIIMAMKPLDGTYAQNAEKWGVAGINIDESRIETTQDLTRNCLGFASALHEGYKRPYHDNAEKKVYGSVKGRWPSNIILDESAADMLDQQGGISKSSNAIRKNNRPLSNCLGKYNPDETYGYSDSGGASRFFYCAKASSSERNKGLDCYVTVKYTQDISRGTLCKEENMVAVELLKKVMSEWEINNFSIGMFGESISVQFPKDISFIIKTKIKQIIESKILNWLTHLLTKDYILDANSLKENGGSLAVNVMDLRKWILTITNEKMELALGASNVASRMLSLISEEENWNEIKCTHPTVKPIALMKYIIKLLAPPNNPTLLDPFAGSGTTLIAAKQLDINAIGIEKEEEYYNIAKARIQNG